MHRSILKKISLVLLCMVISIGSAFAADTTTTETSTTDTATPVKEAVVTPLTPDEMNIKEGLEYGQKFGILDGTIDGRTQQQEGKASAYYKSLPGETTIIEKYNLRDDDLFYRLNFIKAYQDYYEISYNSAYRNGNLSLKSVPVSKGSEYGINAGKIEGAAAAMKDFYLDRQTNWERALDEFLKLGSLNIRYSLDGEAIDYGWNFRTGFREGFFEAYYETFQQTELEAAIRNRTSQLVTTNESTLEFKEEFVSFDGGTLSSEIQTTVALEIPDAAVYKPTYLSLYKDPNNTLIISDLESVSSKYVVAVHEPSGNLFFNKPLVLSFSFNGSENAGIYKLENGKWFYQISTFTDKAIYTEIPKGAYSGGQYMLFIDPENRSFTDTRFNWAQKEINALKRRGYLDEQDLFRPTQFITRLELAKLLYNVYGGESDITTPRDYTIKDKGITQDDFKYITFVVDHSIMPLDSEGKFNSNSTVSYETFEKTMTSVLKVKFEWESLAQKMMFEKYKRSRGLDSLSRPIFRDEVAYALYLYDDLK